MKMFDMCFVQEEKVATDYSGQPGLLVYFVP